MDEKNRNAGLLTRANSLHQAGNLNEAESLLRTILSSDPAHYDALALLGMIHLQRGRRDEGIRLIEQSLDINPRQPAALCARALALNDLKRYAEAVASCDRAIALRPDFVEAHINRGHALNGLKRPAEAVASCDRAIALRPDCAEAHCNRGIALFDLKRHDEALASYDQAIKLNPGIAQAYHNRGKVFSDLKRPVEALADFDRAISLKPDFAGTHNNRGLALFDLNRHVEALASYDRAIALKPDLADAYWNKGILKLLLGEFEEGWALYEWRWKQDTKKAFIRNFPRPLWSGKESLAGKTILLHTEQGFGDSIQFCRYAPMVDALGARVVLEAEPPLVALLATLKDSIPVIPKGSPLPEFDCHCPLMSLPLAFKTTVDTIPATISYLGADPEKQIQWRHRMGENAKPRIGLAWSGRQEHGNDLNRSIPLDLLAPLLDLDYDFHCLQKEIRPADRKSLIERPQVKTHEHYLNEFADTAALAAEMNLVITIDTVAAHLAGALGKPVWILLPFMPDFRWMMKREDSPWYPTARLFRQPQIGDWTSVIDKIVTELKTL